MLPRILALLLLAMNVGVAVWWLLRPAAAPPPLPPATDPDVPPLRLLSELEPLSDSGDSSAMGVPDLGADSLPGECWQIGPFLTQLDLRRAMNALAPLAARLQFRETREIMRRGFRVYLPSPGSREAALTTARRLSRRGVTDYYVVTAGNEQNTISLGLFREEANARSRLEQIEALGFDAEMEPRNEELPQFWLDIELPEQTDWRAQLGGYAGVGGERIDCGLPLPTTEPGAS